MVIIHIVCSLLSYVAFLVAFVSGILFLTQERQVRRKTMGILFHRLPSLGTLDQVNFTAISAGFVLLSLGVLFGMAGVKTAFGRWWIADPKAYLTVMLWASYLALWVMRLRATLRGRRVALFSILGFSLVLFTFLGVTYLLPSLHPYL